MDQLLSQLVEMSCTCSHPLSYTSAAKCFAGLVNKRPQGGFVFYTPVFIAPKLRASLSRLTAFMMFWFLLQVILLTA